MNSLNHIFIILFSIVDLKFWSAKDLVAWVDELVMKIDSPKNWLIDLSMARTRDDQLNVIRRMMDELMIVFPENIGDLMVGIVLLQYDAGRLTNELTKEELIDIIDGNPASGLDAEKMKDIHLDDPAFNPMRAIAKRNIEHLTTFGLIKTDKNLIDN